MDVTHRIHTLVDWLNDNLHRTVSPTSAGIHSSWKDQLAANLVRLEHQKRYSRIVSQTSVIAFIDRATGDIYRPGNAHTPMNRSYGNVCDRMFGSDHFTITNSIKLNY